MEFGNIFSPESFIAVSVCEKNKETLIKINWFKEGGRETESEGKVMKEINNKIINTKKPNRI